MLAAHLASDPAMLSEEVDTSGVPHLVVKLSRVPVVIVVHLGLLSFEGSALKGGRVEEGGAVAHDFEVVESPGPVDVDRDVGSDGPPAVAGSTGVLK